ncbi:MAG TPA: hypothetical protein VFO34_15440 [Candidatus Acidoferrales bacterium]|nr:hypothetical protein [Candidatus Acidoferrales bacterium]
MTTPAGHLFRQVYAALRGFGTRATQSIHFRLRTAVLMSLVVLLFTSIQTAAQTTSPNAATAAISDAAKQGFPLNAGTNVAGNVSVEAVLIPPKISKRVLGGVVGRDYAVIALTISNRSSDSSLIVHNIFIDYTNWGMSGASNGSCSPTTNAAQVPWQASSNPCQVSSVESRIVRGQLLDRQPWTSRNWIIRALQGLGSIATAYEFTLSGQHAIQSIGAFTGQGEPAVEMFWPDATIGQMNRISDLGFQVNKVIPKESSDVVVAFFPIDRFLTPGLRKLFLSSPALFFATDALVLDQTARKKAEAFVGPIFGNNKDTEKTFVNELATGSLSSENQKIHQFLQKLSLNNVHITVGGAMTVDVNDLPPIVNSVDFTLPDGKKLSDVLGSAGTVNAVIGGSFLAGGQVAIVEAQDLGISGVTAVQDQSTDKQLYFKFTLSKAIPTTQQQLTFTVTKKNAQGVTIQSPGFVYKLKQ